MGGILRVKQTTIIPKFKPYAVLLQSSPKGESVATAITGAAALLPKREVKRRFVLKIEHLVA
jgi:hypothetical protein